MSIPSRLIFAAICLVAVDACRVNSSTRSSPSPNAPLPALVFVTNESGLTRRVDLRVNGAVAMDRVVGRPHDLTGLVSQDTVRLVPGEYRLVLVDHYSGQQFTTWLDVRPGPMCILISLFGPRTDFRAGNYTCLFM
jgi:hypothetical protein